MKCCRCGKSFNECKAMSKPEQMEYCNECGQHIARDWSEWREPV